MDFFNKNIAISPKNNTVVKYSIIITDATA